MVRNVIFICSRNRMPCRVFRAWQKKMLQNEVAERNRCIAFRDLQQPLKVTCYARPFHQAERKAGMCVGKPEGMEKESNKRNKHVSSFMNTRQWTTSVPIERFLRWVEIFTSHLWIFNVMLFRIIVTVGWLMIYALVRYWKTFKFTRADENTMERWKVFVL